MASPFAASLSSNAILRINSSGVCRLAEEKVQITRTSAMCTMHVCKKVSPHRLILVKSI